LSGQLIGRPILDGLGTDTDGESSPLFERSVILAPVADAVRGFLFHRKKSIPRHRIRNSSLRFVQQSPQKVHDFSGDLRLLIGVVPGIPHFSPDLVVVFLIFLPPLLARYGRCSSGAISSLTSNKNFPTLRDD
jgi:hypothetical protein